MQSYNKNKTYLQIHDDRCITKLYYLLGYIDNALEGQKFLEQAQTKANFVQI